MKSTTTAYLLWLLIFVGLGGIHRIYAGRVITGVIWLFTGGLFLVGQIIDIFLIPGMIRRANEGR
jgi:TM2 domain-containing membrane protein YozV